MLETPLHPPAQMTRILANTVLPAERERVRLHTTDGLSLEGELSVPLDGPPAACVVCLHPLPTHGGSMDSHLIRKMSWRLPALAQIAVLRFNTRGTGASQGRFDRGDRERFDLAAALDLVEYRDLPAPWIVGWSFGAELALMYGWEDASVVGAVVLAPPLHRAGDEYLKAWAEVGKPLVAVVPERDDYLRPPEARRRFSVVPHAQVVEIARSGHLFVGYAEEALDAVVAAVRPAASPLPVEWPSA